MTEVGGWGPWIVGGGWLTIAGKKVDLLYRPIEAVERVIGECREGRVSMDYQPGHPHGFCSAIWMGEVALCRPSATPEARYRRLEGDDHPYPDKLREALIRRFQWEIVFAIENAETAVPKRRTELTSPDARSGRSLRRPGPLRLNRRYLINEKGALAAAARLPMNSRRSERAGRKRMAGDRAWCVRRGAGGARVDRARTRPPDRRGALKRPYGMAVRERWLNREPALVPIFSSAP